MATGEPTTRDMVRSTLSHEVRGLLLNLGFHLNNLDSSQKASDHSAARAEIDKAKGEIRAAARALSTAINLTIDELKSTTTDANAIFDNNDLTVKSRDLMSRTNRLRDTSPVATNAIDGAALVHRTAVNIERMIKISKSLFGDQATMTIEAINPNTIIKDMEALTPADEAARVRYEKVSTPTFLAYRRELISAASNLVRNGLKYSLDDVPSRVVVELSRRRLVDLLDEFPTASALVPDTGRGDDVWVCLKVSDTGRGIPEGYVGAVFKPFVRLDHKGQPKVLKDQAEPIDGDDDSGANQGFGLTLVKRVAELHQGVVAAKSASPHGMIFALMFPFKANDGTIGSSNSPAS